MKFICLSCFLFVLNLNSLIGFDNLVDKLENYKQLNQIVTNDQGVFFQTEEAWVQAEAMVISSDNIMVLLDNKWISLEDCLCDTYKTWRCRNCKTVNAEGSPTCSNCRKPR